MAKYSSKQLKAMANIVLIAKDKGNIKYTQFIVMVAQKANVSPAYVEDRIKEFAFS